MTINDVRKSDKLYLTPAEVAELLNCDPQAIRDAARHNPEQLGFPTMRVGNRTKIPRMPFDAGHHRGRNGQLLVWLLVDKLDRSGK